jgi:hypothetical protein
MTVLAALALVVAVQSPVPAPSTSPAPSASPAAAPSPASKPAAVAPAAVLPPAADAIVALVKQAPAFSADSGRTALAATPEKRLAVPGVGDLGLFVEIQWTDKEGKPQQGLAVVAHESVQDVPWMVKAAPWGLVQIIEGQTVEGAGTELKRARMIANESDAVRDIRTVYSAEMLFMAVADGAYGELRCLNIPADCVTEIPGERLLEKDITAATEKSGYRRKFHAGERVKSAKAKGSPSPFVKTFAYTAVPTNRGETGMRSFCGDNTGRICVVDDGWEPKVVGGLCTPCVELVLPESKPAETKK